MADAASPPIRMNCFAVRLARNASVSQNRPLTVTSMTSSGVSLQVARWTTWVTPSIARSTAPRSEIVLFDHLEPRRRGKGAIVAQSADDEVGMRLRAQPPDEVRSRPFRSRP